MPYAVKHVGTPDVCPACILPADQFARREAVWSHALAQFADQSRVDVNTLPMSDLVPLVRSWARARMVADMERTLLAESPRPPAARRFEPRSARLALCLMLAVCACLALICSSAWRLFS